VACKREKNLKYIAELGEFLRRNPKEELMLNTLLKYNVIAVHTSQVTLEGAFMHICKREKEQTQNHFPTG